VIFQLSVQQQPKVGMLDIIRKVTENVTKGPVWHYINPWCTSALSSEHSSDLYVRKRPVDLQGVERRAMKRVKGIEWLLSEERLKRLEIFHLER